MLKNCIKFRCFHTVFVRPCFLVKRATNLTQLRFKKDDSSISQLFIPVPIKPSSDDINVGAELTGNLNKADLLKILNTFYQRKEIKLLLSENGMDSK